MQAITLSGLHINFRFFSKYALFVILIFQLNTIYCQTKPFVISGQVIDSLNRKPIPNINIISTTNDIGVITDINGFFEILAPSTSDTLVFSFVGYKTIQIFLHYSSDTNILVRLLPTTYSLNEVTISSNKNTYNSFINNVTILDYDFLGDSILVLQKSRSMGGKPSLVLLDSDYDTLLYCKDIPRRANKIFKDCLHSFHILTKDSAYQIVFQDKSISFYKPIDIHWFYQTLENCLFEKDGNIFFEFPVYQGYGHEIFFINEKNKKKNLFVKYVDTKSLSNLRDDISAISSDYYLHSVVNASTNDSLAVSHINSFNRSSRYIREFGDQPIENSICLLDDTIFYFNYYESKIQSYFSLKEPPIEIPIDYKNTYGWGSKLLIDHIEEKIYSIHKNKAFYQIYLVNTGLGKIQFRTKVSLFKSENLKINNGYVYYLSRPNSSAYHVRKLSRIKL